MSFRMTQPIFHRALHSGFHDEVYVDGESRELMLEIKKALSVFEPVDDDEARVIWLEIPRGTAEEWRDYEESMKEFERKAMNMTLPMNFKFVCTMGTVQRTISNHPYMRKPIDKWKENGASTREIVLAGYLRNFLL